MDFKKSPANSYSEFVEHILGCVEGCSQQVLTSLSIMISTGDLGLLGFLFQDHHVPGRDFFRRISAFSPDET